MKLVLDTNVVVSALLWDGAPRQLLLAGSKPVVHFFTSAPLVSELTETLSRPKFDAKIKASLLTVYELVNLYIGMTYIVVPAATPRIAPDPDDDVVIGTAIAADADFLVTGDRTLLSVDVFDGGRIVTISEALKSTHLQ